MNECSTLSFASKSIRLPAYKRALDDSYREFCSLVADLVATGVTNSRVYEEERKRTNALMEMTGLNPTLSARAESPRGERILFADDNADMRDYVSRLLGERWTVETVSDGEAALANMRRRPEAAHYTGHHPLCVQW